MSDERLKRPRFFFLSFLFFLARPCFDSPLSRRPALPLTKAEGRRGFAGRNSPGRIFSLKAGLSSLEHRAAHARDQQVINIQVRVCHVKL